jgi:hypothetical protein
VEGRMSPPAARLALGLERDLVHAFDIPNLGTSSQLFSYVGK